ncbi:copper amine oxidase 1 [Microdochium trichocladiopsis]|uniref:Amine oxidase n=1 Tax=Microdochium trichocladiopsis TaxID=1682393 RepID=A0A9P8YFW0_9PEZI|nr:copper amine oxidase 1 [Microdochium trichocladiopsis]KAH7037275.1 copper amine oxidase 1 [Microdochium trichocladiopsis]
MAQPNGSDTALPPHPLRPLSQEEAQRASAIAIQAYAKDVSTTLTFRIVQLHEPEKAELVEFLKAEHAGAQPSSVPARQAEVLFDVVKDGQVQLIELIVDLDAAKVANTRSFPPVGHTGLIPPEFGQFQDACLASEIFSEAMAEFDIPDKFKIIIDPWPYGGPDPDEEIPRYMQGLVYARDSSNDNPDSNHYAYPLPIIPVMDMTTKKIIRVDRMATGGKGESLHAAAKADKPKKLFEQSTGAEYVPELLDIPLRQDAKPINVVQPEGASFKVHSDNLVEWQKWRFRVGFTPREGAVLHDVCYDGRPIVYRLSFSEMTVPYGDPRPPYHRKQAFDFGDGGCGRAANNLELGCDCLGAIHYFDAWMPGLDGEATLSKNVVCLHEQDNGVGWKHTNFRTGRAVVTRLRELVVQYIVTLANYEYIFAYKLDTAGGITVETRATGIVSVVPIDYGKTSDYGNVVSPGTLAQNHQHIFAIRVDPSIDSYSAEETSVVVEETHPIPMNPETNPHGNGYEIRRTVVDRPRHLDAEPKLNRVVRIENSTKTNPISGKNVAYKFTPSATQLLLADPGSVQAARAQFATHHVWVTGYRDGELWAAGELTNQSRRETGGVRDMTERGDWFAGASETSGGSGNGQQSSPVIWTVFGLTHNPRVEDWPVMPVEIHQIHIRPADFFTRNPALDVPANANKTSVLVPCCNRKDSGEEAAATNGDASEGGAVQKDPVTHLQGTKAVDPAELPLRTDKDKKRLSTTLSGLFGFGKKA